MRNIILGDGNTLKILRKHKAYKNIEYVNEKVYVTMSLGYEKHYVKIEDEDKPRLDEVITWI